jgi:hypothetical protein
VKGYGLRTIKREFRIAKSEVVCRGILFWHFDNIFSDEYEIGVFEFIVEMIFPRTWCKDIDGRGINLLFFDDFLKIIVDIL